MPDSAATVAPTCSLNSQLPEPAPGPDFLAAELLLHSRAVPRVAMLEIGPNRYWVLINFPGRTSLTLTTTANLQLATELMDTARRVAAEALAYVAEKGNRQ